MAQSYMTEDIQMQEDKKLIHICEDFYSEKRRKKWSYFRVNVI